MSIYKLVGLSISRCIKDIAEGRIPLEAVDRIVGGTSFSSQDELWLTYSEVFWKSCCLKAREVLTRLYQEGRIDQPRLRQETPPDAGAGIWQVEDMCLETPIVQILLAMSSFLQGLSKGQRTRMFEELPEEVLDVIVAHLDDPPLTAFFAQTTRVTESVPSRELHRMVINRLKSHFARSGEEEAQPLHPRLLKLMQPYLRAQMTSRRSGRLQAVQVPEKFSRVSIRLPDKEG